MKHQLTECPTTDVLERFLAGELVEEQLDAIALHINTCARCRREVEGPAQVAALADDVRWTGQEVARSTVDLTVPVARLNELLTDYEVEAEIGRGGMGIVYRARQIKLNRVVALKVLPALLAAVRPDAIARFRREAELAARLKHNNIIAVYDFGEAEGTLYYAMELIEGRSLQSIVAEIASTRAVDVVVGIAGPNPSGGSAEEVLLAGAVIGRSTTNRIGVSTQHDRLYFRRVAEWIADVAEALHYAHEQGVIHRDIKPSNLLLNREGRLMISDFGLAHGPGAQSITASRSLLGTLRYMSPEQLDEEHGEVDRRTDVYGLGATLYELLAFRPMFAGRDDRDVLSAVLNIEPTPPRRLVRQVPRELETICLKALEKDRDVRYATAKDLADDLRRWLLGVPILARRPTLVVRAIKLAQRRKVAVATTVLLIALAAATAFWYVRSTRWEASALAASDLAGRREVELIGLDAQKDLDDGRLEPGLQRIEEALTRHPHVADLQVKRARLLHGLRRRGKAVAGLEAFAAKAPEEWEAHHYLAVLYGEAGNKEKANRHATLAQKHMPPDSPKAYHLLAALERDPKKSLVLINKTLELDPADIGSVLMRVRLNKKLRDFDQMLADARSAVAMRPQWGICHGYLGGALIHVAKDHGPPTSPVQIERYNKAIEALGRAIELDPSDPLWWTARGIARYEIGQFDGALFDANRAIELDSRFARAYSCRGRARAEVGETAAGLMDCSRAIELEPKNVEHYLERVWLYKMVGDWDKVGDDATKIIELRPDDPRGHGWRAESYARRSRYKEAIDDYARAIELNPNDFSCIHDRGTCYLRIGQPENAAADYTRNIRLDPEHGSSYADRAQAYWRMGKRTEAMADLTRARELGVNTGEAALLRSAASIRLGLFDEAIEDCTRVLEVTPNDAVVLLCRGMAYEVTGSVAEALKDYTRAAGQGGVGAEYARLWDYLLRRLSNGHEAAPPVLRGNERGQGQKSWTDRLFMFFHDNIGAEELVRGGDNEDHRAEAHYYIGMKSLIEGRPSEARRAFESCINSNREAVLETDFARARLKQLDARVDSHGIAK